jgi:D-serine deaminase-like pyridoxal phosphate-dependent protein
MRLNELDTPALILDRAVLDRNLAATTARAAAAGVRLRPHLKTAKSADIAQCALAGNFGGIAVSTLQEAAYFADHGISDILYAVALAPDKVARLKAIERRTRATITAITDSPVALALMIANVVQGDTPLALMIEIDCGDGRSGVDPNGPDLIELGHAVKRAPGIAFRGVMTHAGQSYRRDDAAGVAAVAGDQSAALTTAARRLRELGLPCPIVSGSNSRVLKFCEVLPGLTEIRCGIYMFWDAYQYGKGMCAREDMALSVLATVIGHRPELNAVVIDAGALALSKDRSTQGTTHDIGYGWVFDGQGLAPLGDLTVSTVFQEHGLVTSRGSMPWDRVPIGARLRIYPNHACITAAGHSRYHVVSEDGADIVAAWDRCNYW